MFIVLWGKGDFHIAKVQPQAHMLAMLHQHDKVGEVWVSFLQGIVLQLSYSQVSIRRKRSSSWLHKKWCASHIKKLSNLTPSICSKAQYLSLITLRKTQTITTRTSTSPKRSSTKQATTAHSSNASNCLTVWTSSKST